MVPTSMPGPPSAVSAASVLDHGTRGGGERRLAHQVLGRIAGDEQLGEDDEIGALGGRLGARLAQLGGVAGEIADDRIELGQGDLQPIGDCVRHGRTLRLAPRRTQRGNQGRQGMSGKAATALGCGAILLWSTLASLTVLSGGLPPFQTTAIAFAIGAAVIGLAAIARGRAAAMRPTPASLALGVYGLFGYHALYFAALRLAPPAEAHLVSSLWALLIVLFSALLPGHRLRQAHVLGALLGFAAATLLVWSRLGDDAVAPAGRLGFVLALGCALVWSSYSVASRLLASVPSESLAASCLVTRCSRWPAAWRWRRGSPLPVPSPGSRSLPWARPARRRLPAVGHRHEAGRHLAARRARLRVADPVDRAAGGSRSCRADLGARRRLPADGGGRGHRHAAAERVRPRVRRNPWVPALALQARPG